MTKSKIFLILNLSFLGGLFLFYLPAFAKVLASESAGLALLTYFLVIFFIIVVAVFWKNRKMRFIAFIGLFFITGFLRSFFAEDKIAKEKNIYKNLNSEVIIEGIIKEETSQGEKSAQTILANISLLENNIFQKIPGKVLVSTEAGSNFEYGTLLKIKGKLVEPESFNDFDYKSYLEGQEIYKIMFRPKILEIQKGKGNFLMAQIFKTRKKFEEASNYLWPDKESSIFKGVTLGLQKGTSKELKESFRKTGISHLTAVSGFNVSIAAMIFLYLLFGLGIKRKIAFYFASAGIFLFVILVGAPASAVRAGIMGFLLLFAERLGRLNKSENAIVFAAAVMLLIKPDLVKSISFELSFAATLGIIYLYPLFGKFFLPKLPDYLGLKSIFLVTISAQIATLPIIIYQFEQMSLIAPLTNILVLPVIPFIMIFGSVALFFYFISKIVGLVLAWPAYLFIKYLILVAESNASFKFASIKITGFNFVFLIFYYLILAVIYIYFKKRIYEKEKISL